MEPGDVAIVPGPPQATSLAFQMNLTPSRAKHRLGGRFAFWKDDGS